MECVETRASCRPVGGRRVYIFGFVVTGSLLFGLGGYLMYREVKRIWPAVWPLERLPNQTDGLYRAVHTQSLLDLSRKLDARSPAANVLAGEKD